MLKKDKVMKVKLFVGILIVLGVTVAQAHAQYVDQYGNTYTGNIQPSGHVDMFDSQGNYHYGNVQPNGQADMFDSQGNHYDGTFHR